MKKIIFSLLILISLSASAWDVPKYYLKPITPAFSAPFVKPVKKLFYGPISIDYLYYNSPCNSGHISARISCFYTDVVARQYTLTINFLLPDGRTLNTQQIFTMPAYANQHYLGIMTSDSYCQNTITYMSVAWYTPQW